MELVSFAKEVLQNVAEQVASYRIGQQALRQLDKALWVVEKCARWAVPPPLDQDDHPQPELVRPLPWVFFLMLLVALRVTRETMSLVYLALGKPPLRSADVVMYIQSKRRYLRTLKYQGSRMMRARSTPAPRTNSWLSALRSLFEFTICFKRQSNYGNNNTTRVSNNEEILVVKRSKVVSADEASSVASSAATLERLIEKMMVDFNADSEDDSSYTLTNATSVKSEECETTSENESEPKFVDVQDKTQDESEIKFEEEIEIKSGGETDIKSDAEREIKSEEVPENKAEGEIENKSEEEIGSDSESNVPEQEQANENENINKEKYQMKPEKKSPTTFEGGHLRDATNLSPKKQLENFIENECQPIPSIKNDRKIANGRMVRGDQNRTGDRVDRRDADVPVVRITTHD